MSDSALDPATGAAIDDLAEDVPEKRVHPALAALRRLLRHRLFLTGLVLFGVIAIAAIFAPWLTTANPNRLVMRAKFTPPGAEWVFGTDSFGRSLWSRTLYGARLSMMIGGSVVLINAVLGTALGAVAGYFRATDNALMRMNDALMAFPAILLAIAVTAVLGPSTVNVIIALGIVYTPRTARIVRSSVIVLREMEYVQAAVAAGAGHWRILRRHVLPNAMAPMIVQLSFLFAYAVLAEATLSFLGVGAPPPTPTWGGMMAEGRDFIRDAPWIITIPGLALMITVMGLNMLGDGLRDVLDPRLRIQQ